MNNIWIRSIKIFILGLFVFIYGCDKSIIYEDNVTVELNLSQNTLSNNDTLTGTFTIINNSPETKTFQFVNSCQFGLIISLSGETQYNEPSGCRESSSELQLLAGESREFEISYSLKDNDGKDLPPGKYEIEAFLFNTEYKVHHNFQIK